MPVINFDYEDLIGLVGRRVPPEELLETIPMMGADLQDFNRATGEMSIEFFPDRPDLYSVEGIARALGAFIGEEPGLKDYLIKDPFMDFIIDPSVEEVRPSVVGGVVRDVRMTDALIKSLMELQEKLHLTVGRNRAKVSIGIHDMDNVEPPFTYKAIDPKSLSFVPLQMNEEMNLSEILERHEKGRKYSFILEDKETYPIITDTNGGVLSFPPIINGVLTQVTEDTENIFIDVTGTDPLAVEGALNIVATTMAERGGHIEAVNLKGTVERTTPDLRPGVWDLDLEGCRSWLGIDFSPEEVCSTLRRMGFGCGVSDNGVEVLSPATRMDLLHPVDLMEDVAIGYGYDHFGSQMPKVQTTGGEKTIERISGLMRDLMVGYGYVEATTLMLSSEEKEFHQMGLPEREVARILNPIGVDHTCIRVHLVPSLLSILRKSKHRDLPQKVFEVGDVIINGSRSRHMAALSMHSKASFTEVKSLVESIMRNTSINHSISPYESEMFIEGRAASVSIDGRPIGYFGELHPQVITNHELGYPVIAAELDLDEMFRGKMARVI